MERARPWLAALLGLVAVVGIPLGALSIGVQRGVFEREHAEAVAGRLVEDDRMQQEVAERFVDAAVEAVPELASARERLLQLGFALQSTAAYRSLAGRAVDRAYERVLEGGSGAVRVSVTDLLELVGGGLGLPSAVGTIIPDGAAVELMDAAAADSLRALDRATQAIGIPALLLGSLAVLGVTLLPGARWRRLAVLGAAVAVASLLTFGLAAIAGSRLESLFSGPGGLVAGAIWAEGLPTVRASLIGAFVGGVALLAAGLAIDVYRA
jgi:hypothetical protein